MKTEQMTNFIDWFRDILLAFENFFHQVQSWLDGTIYPSEWFQNLIAEDESETEAE